MRNTLRKTITIFLTSFLTICLFATATFADSQSIDSAKFRTAVVQELELQAGGSASILRDGVSMKAEKGVRLVPGDTITTVGQAKLYILIDQDKVLRLDHDSQVVLKETFFGTKIKIQLVAGRLFYNVMRQLPENENLDFASGNVTITVRGTSGLIGAKEDKFEHMLFDGHTQVDSGTKTVMQIPGQEISFHQVAGQQYEDSLDIRHFVLDELPESLIEEINKDPVLKERVLSSVPKAYAEDGTPEFADPATFDTTQLKGVKDDAIMPMTSKPVPSSTSGGSSSGGSYTPPTPPAPPTPPTPPEPVECPGCKKMIPEVGAPGHKLIDSPSGCGCKVYECNKEPEKHKKETCTVSDCTEENKEYYVCHTEEADKHALVWSIEDSQCGHAIYRCNSTLHVFIPENQCEGDCLGYHWSCKNHRYPSMVALSGPSNAAYPDESDNNQVDESNEVANEINEVVIEPSAEEATNTEQVNTEEQKPLDQGTQEDPLKEDTQQEPQKPGPGPLHDPKDGPPNPPLPDNKPTPGE